MKETNDHTQEVWDKLQEVFAPDDYHPTVLHSILYRCIDQRMEDLAIDGDLSDDCDISEVDVQAIVERLLAEFKQSK